MFGKRTSRSFEAKRRHCQVSLTRWHGDSTPRPLGRQSRALTTELERATCGKLRCRGPFISFLTNPFICFEGYSNIERINEGIISNAKHEQQKPNSGNPSLAQPMSGLVTATCFDWATGMPTFARVVRHPVKNTRELPQLYRHTARKRGPDEYGGGLANALSFLWFGILQWQSRNLWNTTARVSEWHLIWCWRLRP